MMKGNAIMLGISDLMHVTLRGCSLELIAYHFLESVSAIKHIASASILAAQLKIQNLLIFNIQQGYHGNFLFFEVGRGLFKQ